MFLKQDNSYFFDLINKRISLLELGCCEGLCLNDRIGFLAVDFCKGDFIIDIISCRRPMKSGTFLEEVYTCFFGCLQKRFFLHFVNKAGRRGSFMLALLS